MEQRLLAFFLAVNLLSSFAVAHHHHRRISSSPPPAFTPTPPTAPGIPTRAPTLTPSTAPDTPTPPPAPADTPTPPATPTPPPAPDTPTPPATPASPPPAGPAPPSGGTCPINTLRLATCAKVLNLLRLNIGIPPEDDQCCPLLQGLVDLDAAVCLCLAIRANVVVLGAVKNLPVDLTLLLNFCQKDRIPGFTCPT